MRQVLFFFCLCFATSFSLSSFKERTSRRYHTQAEQRVPVTLVNGHLGFKSGDSAVVSMEYTYISLGYQVTTDVSVRCGTPVNLDITFPSRTGISQYKGTMTATCGQKCIFVLSSNFQQGWSFGCHPSNIFGNDYSQMWLINLMSSPVYLNGLDRSNVSIKVYDGKAPQYYTIFSFSNSFTLKHDQGTITQSYNVPSGTVNYVFITGNSSDPNNYPVSVKISSTSSTSDAPSRVSLSLALLSLLVAGSTLFSGLF